VLTTQQLGKPAIQGVEADAGYIKWLYLISHPHMILPNQDVHITRPPEQEAIVEDGEQGYLDLARSLGRIRDHVYVVMSSGVIAQGSPECVHLEVVLTEVYGGRVYHRRHDVEGGRGRCRDRG